MVDEWSGGVYELVKGEGEHGVGCTELCGLNTDGAGTIGEGTAEKLHLEFEGVDVLR